MALEIKHTFHEKKKRNITIDKYEIVFVYCS